MSLTLITAPSGEVLTLQEVREHLRIDHAHDDVYLLGLIRAATDLVDGRLSQLNRAMLTQTWDEALDCFPYRNGWQPITLSLSPVASVTHVKYVDPDGAEQTWPSTDYQTDLKSEPARIFPAVGKSYPSIRHNTFNAITIRYVAGFGPRVQVPDSIRHPLCALIAYWYENREGVAVGEGVTVATPLPMFIESMFLHHRVWQAA